VDQLLAQPATFLSSKASLPILAEAVQLLLELFRDLSSQDLPPYFEENLGDYMGNSATGEKGLILKYLTWEPAELKGDVSHGTSIRRQG
jgi:exportin-2 (importin alpha re-exporter)